MWFLLIFIPYLASFLNEVLSIILYLLGIKFSILDGISDQENTDTCLKYIKDHSQFISLERYSHGDTIPDSLCIKYKGKDKYIAYVVNKVQMTDNRSKDFSTIWYIGKINFKINKRDIIFNNNNDNDNNNNNNKIAVWDRDSDYRDSFIYKFDIPFNKEPYQRQTEVMDKILEIYNESDMNICRAFISGKVGCGKSYIGKILTRKLNGQLATHINLSSPGSGFRHLYKKAMPTKECPLIIQLDELDVTIKKIHEGNIKTDHIWLITECCDKPTFTTFWSEVVTKYPYVIWLSTSNSTLEDMNKLDECYLRKNRQDLSIEY